jgi:hypothetical protein
MQGKDAYIRLKVVGPFSRPCASGSYVHQAALLLILVTMTSWVQVVETTSCRNVGKCCVHKTQSDRTLPWTLRKQKLRAPGCPFTDSFLSKCRNNMLFGYTEMLCLFTNNILGVTSMIMYILMLGGRCIFCSLN